MAEQLKRGAEAVRCGSVPLERIFPPVEYVHLTELLSNLLVQLCLERIAIASFLKHMHSFLCILKWFMREWFRGKAPWY